MPRALKGLPYRFRFKDGSLSRGGFKDFESAAASFLSEKRRLPMYSERLKDVVCIPEREPDYLKGL